MYWLSIYLIQIQSYRAFSKMAVDHWCLSLRLYFNHPTSANSIVTSLADQVMYISYTDRLGCCRPGGKNEKLGMRKFAVTDHKSIIFCNNYILIF